MKSVWRALPVERSRSEMQDFRRWPKRSRVDVDVDVDDDTAFIYLCKMRLLRLHGTQTQQCLRAFEMMVSVGGPSVINDPCPNHHSRVSIGTHQSTVAIEFEAAR